MGRLHVETIQIDPVLLRRSADGAVLAPEILADYAAKLRAQGRRTDSVRSCERVLRQFYDFLSADKLVGKDTLQAWRDQLLAEHYAVRSVNSKVSTLNALLESMGCREFQVTKQLPAEDFDTPELTRQEYVRMLQTAKILEDERAYVLTKLFATTGIAVLDLPAVTVEAVQTGHDRPRRPEIGQEAGDRPLPGQPASGPAALRPRKWPPLRHDFHEKGRLRHRQNASQPVHPKAGAGGQGARREGQYSGFTAAV